VFLLFTLSSSQKVWLLLPDAHLYALFSLVSQDARPVVVREAGTREVAEADGEEERGAGRSEEPEGKTAGGDDAGRKDHRRAERTGRCSDGRELRGPPASASCLTSSAASR